MYKFKKQTDIKLLLQNMFDKLNLNRKTWKAQKYSTKLQIRRDRGKLPLLVPEIIESNLLLHSIITTQKYDKIMNNQPKYSWSTIQNRPT